MDWQHPEFLYLILPLTAVWFGLALYSERRRHRAREAFVAQAMWSRILPETSPLRFWMKLGLREVAIVMGLIALAGPRWGDQYEDVVARGSDLYVLIDVSRSMLADDVPPTRLGRAKADVSSLVNQLEGERVGLIAFAGQAVVKCPLTVDYDAFRRILDELDPDSAPRGGTAIGDAIRKALEVFHAKSERDQAILLITDGDDQESYPLEAASVAAERHVTIFTVGLGDVTQGHHVPQKADNKAFIEYKGEQVWSKLDSHLLQEIALKTSGVYVPAGTHAYDLGELYTQHLRGRKGADAATQQRLHRSEQFQMFLALALAALLFDLCLSVHPRTLGTSNIDPLLQPTIRPGRSKPTQNQNAHNLTVPLILACFLLKGLGGIAAAAEPRTSVREGLRLYSKEEYEAAREKFAAASEVLDKEKSAAAAIAAFDEACASHREGDWQQARESYLKAGLSLDKSIATASHFNLGNLSAEQARKLAGDKPEEVPAEKRPEILEHLKQAIAAYRHCLELQPEHVQSRRNLELVRQWIKYYTDQWSERDRQKRRDESNLIVFLEYLMTTQAALKETAAGLPAPVHSDTIAELKRAQDELHEEIPTLREKIANDLRPKPQPGTTAAPAAPTDPQQSKQLAEGIALLQGWADKAGSRMSIASSKLQTKETKQAGIEQQAAIDELDQIWDAVIPFHPLLTKELADQTAIAKELAPEAPAPEQTGDKTETPKSTETGKAAEPAKETQEPKSKSTPDKLTPAKPADIDAKDGLKTEILPADSKSTPHSAGSQVLDETTDDLKRLTESQEKAIRKTRLLAPKAAAELERLKNSPPAGDRDQTKSGKAGEEASGGKPMPQPRPEEGFQKAIELAPKAVEQMEAAVKAMKRQDRPTAAQSAEEARKILEEIQKTQPPQEQKQDDKKQDDQKQKDQDQKQDEKQKTEEQKKQDQKDKEQQDKEQKDKEQKQDDKKQDDKKQDKDQQNKDKKDQKQQDEKNKEQQGKQDPQKQPGQVSPERIEEALRKVRERQQAKRERDKKLKGQALGRSPVDKDW